MLTAEENELVTRVGPGTPMRALLSRYWYPVLKSEELVAGGSPQRVRLFGENYAAFRAHDGRVGLLDEGCPHRRASLLLARNDDCALTCIFHGWKVDVSGKVVDAPSEGTARERFATKVKVRHFPTREAGGLIWAFVGEGEPTQFPDFEFTSLPADQVTILKIPVDCNWLQGIEGLIDSSHVGHLHASTLDTVYLRNDGGAALTKKLFMKDLAPKYEVFRTDYGMQAAAVRNVGEGERFVRVTEVTLPSWTFIPQPEDEDCLMMVQVPVDDTHTIQFYIMYNFDHPIDKTGVGHGFQSMLDYDGATFHQHASEENRWTQDRSRLADGHSTGFKNILYEDLAVIESMGPIADRTREYLGSADAGITRFRRILIESARAASKGEPVTGLDRTLPYNRIRARQAVYPETQDWRDAIAPVSAG
jgi:phenylpropionate dioxygenase-like ring-hydroxylating dioxygenase large terminal subunit